MAVVPWALYRLHLSYFYPATGGFWGLVVVFARCMLWVSLRAGAKQSLWVLISASSSRCSHHFQLYVHYYHLLSLLVKNPLFAMCFHLAASRNGKSKGRSGFNPYFWFISSFLLNSGIHSKFTWSSRFFFISISTLGHSWIVLSTAFLFFYCKQY